MSKRNVTTFAGNPHKFELNRETRRMVCFCGAVMNEGNVSCSGKPAPVKGIVEVVNERIRPERDGTAPVATDPFDAMFAESFS